jgi:hypothetical protein
MTAERLEAFKREILKGQPVPDDLQKLWAMQAAREPGTQNAADPLARLGARLIEPGMDVSLLSHAYLTEKDRANPDIMANVAAIGAVLALATFVMELDDGQLLGYWHGPEQTPIEDAALIEFDTEGQFYFVSGLTITEAMLGYELRRESDFAQMRDWCAKLGILISARSLAELEHREAKTNPSTVHLEAYNRHRVAAGLSPI